MYLDEQQLAQVKSCGLVGTQPNQICKILGFVGETRRSFLIDFENEESKIRMIYDEGVAIGEYNIDAKLTKEAEKGDVFSIQQLKKNQEKREVDDLVKNLFGV
jgi:hypothetical protein